jgi:hypothetical protein
MSRNVGSVRASFWEEEEEEEVRITNQSCMGKQCHPRDVI